MNALFSSEPNLFSMFSYSHIGALICISCFSLLIAILRKSFQKNISLKKAIRVIIPVFTSLMFLINYLTQVKIGVFDVRYSLPLHLCDLSMVIVIFLFITYNKYIFELTYFLGIGGATQALMTPALDFDFPHFLFFFFFYGHGIVIISALYFLLVEKIELTIYSFLRSIVYLNAIGVIVLLINLILKSNYMFLLRKPDSASLMDLLGSWPFYIMVCDLVAAFVFFLLYLPVHFFKFKK